MSEKGSGVRKGVLVVSSIGLVLEFIGLILSIVLFFMASSEPYRNILARTFVTRLYHRDVWAELRRNRAFEYHVLISCIIQGLMILPTILLVIGIATKKRFLLLPWLFLYALFQLALLVSVVLCILYLPEDAKLLSLGIIGFETFILFPWWYSVIHLFQLFCHEQFVLTTLSTMTTPDLTLPSWNYSSLCKSSMSRLRTPSQSVLGRRSALSSCADLDRESHHPSASLINSRQALALQHECSC